MIAGLLASSATASALSQRGHSFAFSFASKGQSAGRLSHPAGVAINEATGEVYVADAGNNRIERFNAAGEFIAAWGWGVSDGKGEYEICTSGCGAGLAGEGQAQLNAPDAIAIDNSRSAADPSRGDVYVLADTAAQNNRIEKFSAAGAPLGKLHFANEATGALGGVAVDSGGSVWVSDLGISEIASFSNDELNEALPAPVPLELDCAETRGLAVDAEAEALYVSHQLADVNEECPEKAPSAKEPALIAKLSAGGEVLSEALGAQNTSGVAVDQASSEATPLGQPAKGDVYVDNQTSVATYGADGEFIQRFGSGEQLTGASGVAIDSNTGEVYVADAKASRVAVFSPEAAGAPRIDGVSFENLSPSSTRLQARVDPHGLDTHYYFQFGTADCRATPASCTDVPAPPGQDAGSGFGAQPASALASGLEPGTAYFYRVIATNSEGEAEASQALHTFTTLPSSSEVLADGRSWELVSPPEKKGALIYPIGGTTENSGPLSGVIETSQDGGAITYAANAPFGEGVSGNRALEAAQLLSTRGSEAWSTQDIVTPTEAAEGLHPGASPEYRWFSADLKLGLVEPFGPFALTGTHLQQPPLVPGLSQEERGLYIRHDDTCGASPGTCYEPLVTPAADQTGAQFGGELEVAGATADLRHAVFASNVALSTTAPSAPGLYEWDAQKPAAQALQLISVLPGNKKAVEEPAPQLGDFVPGVSIVRNAISEDGSRVFWSAVVETGSASITRLFMRDTANETTIQINAAQGVKAPHGEEAEKEEVHFRTASADGSKVFFTDNFPLTTQSRLQPREGSPADLYVCEVSVGAEGDACNLTDLTVNTRPESGEGADVLGTVLGASNDGSYVYFVANGVLSEEAEAQGAHAGDCARPSAKVKAQADAKCNLYLAHYDAASAEWQAPRFIATLSQEDQPDWGLSGSLALSALTSRVSPSGRFLAFMSKESLTGYDNRDASAQAAGARDEEVFLYDAATQELLCTSCAPSGARPRGVFDHASTGEGKGLLVDRVGVWQELEAEEQGGPRRVVDHWLAASIPGWTPTEEGTALYQSRYLSDDGRLFFNSPDSLVPHDSNGKEDVYQYEPQGIGSCTGSPGCVALISSGESDRESAFLDASVSAEDVFFLTNRQLVAADRDTSFDVYDAHVCSSASPCLPQPGSSVEPCESLSTCRPAYTPQQVISGPSGSATGSSSGNVSAGQNPPGTGVKGTTTLGALTRAERLAKALKACRKKHKGKGKRVACERQARKKYSVHKRRKRAKAAHGAAGRGRP
jgi:DNA-binding beta-propeller fold protein YncE